MAISGKKVMVLALLFGGAAAVLGYYSLTAMTARAAAGTTAAFRDVVVTGADLTYGVKLEKTMLRIARYPKDAVPVGAYSTMDSVVGQTTKVFMGAREPVTSIKLSSRGGGLSMLIRTTMRAASIEVNQVSGVSGFVLPGDRVDVLNTVDGRGPNGSSVTGTILQNIEVLAAGQKTQQGDSKPMSVQAVTLLVDPKSAEILAHASHEGEIHLVLRNPDDQSEVPLNDLTTTRGSEPPAHRETRARRTSSPAPDTYRATNDDPRKIRIIRSADVTETPAVVDSSAR